MLALGESVTADIDARRGWNTTGIVLEAGHRYRFVATGTWSDWGRPCGPDGYPSDKPILRLTEWLRWSRTSPWFMLVGRVGRGRVCQFAIGADATLTATRSGPLSCAANDVPVMVWNNEGMVTLAVTRIA